MENINAGEWKFTATAYNFKLTAEAYRIKSVSFFEKYLAVHTSFIEPLPHQISAVYERMLPRQPLRFVLADDPGAGKTIMAGLLLKELIVREEIQRCLIVCPGTLVEQWQDELQQKFYLDFELLTGEKIIDYYYKTAYLLKIPKEEVPQYEQYIQKEQDYLASKRYEKDEAFWKAKYEKKPSFVTLSPNQKSDHDVKAKRNSYVISEKETEAIHQYCEKNNIDTVLLLGDVNLFYVDGPETMHQP